MLSSRNARVTGSKPLKLSTSPIARRQRSSEQLSLEQSAGQLERDMRDHEESFLRCLQARRGFLRRQRRRHVNSPCNLQGQLERDVRDPEERRARDLQAQRGLLALAERFLILHASKIVALMMFWAAMAQPGAIGWLLLGMKLPCIYLRQYIHLNDATVLNAASWAAYTYSCGFQCLASRL